MEIKRLPLGIPPCLRDPGRLGGGQWALAVSLAVTANLSRGLGRCLPPAIGLTVGLLRVKQVCHWQLFHCIQLIIIFCTSDLLGYCRGWYMVACKLKMWSAELGNRAIPVLTRACDRPGESGLPYPYLGPGTCLPGACGVSSSSLPRWSGPVPMSGSGCGAKSHRPRNHLGASRASLPDSTNRALGSLPSASFWSLFPPLPISSLNGQRLRKGTSLHSSQGDPVLPRAPLAL